MYFRQWLRRRWIGLYMKIVREKASPEYIARGWAIGMFCGCLIPFGFQLVCSIPMAFAMKGSKIGATLGTMLTNHVTIFFIYPAQCFVGSRLLGGTLSFREIEEAFGDVIKNQDYETLFSLSGELIAAFFVGGVLLTLVTTPLTYVAVLKLVRAYRRRRERRAAAKAAKAAKQTR